MKRHQDDDESKPVPLSMAVSSATTKQTIMMDLESLQLQNFDTQTMANNGATTNDNQQKFSIVTEDFAVGENDNDDEDSDSSVFVALSKKSNEERERWASSVAQQVAEWVANTPICTKNKNAVTRNNNKSTRKQKRRINVLIISDCELALKHRQQLRDFGANLPHQVPTSSKRLKRTRRESFTE